MTESFVTSDDLQFFAKQLSQGNLFSSVELQDYAGQVAWSVKDASQGKSFFPPIPKPQPLDTIEVDFDGENNKVVLVTRQPSQDENPVDENVVVVIPQTLPAPPQRAILRKSPPSSPVASPKRSKKFWRKSKTATVAAS